MYITNYILNFEEVKYILLNLVVKLARIWKILAKNTFSLSFEIVHFTLNKIFLRIWKINIIYITNYIVNFEKVKYILLNLVVKLAGI